MGKGAFDPVGILTAAGQADDAKINLVRTALALAAPHHPGISIGRYENHVTRLVATVAERFRELKEGGADDDAGTRLAALMHVMADKEGYAGDEDSYHDFQNADLIRVIDRRKGLPVALALLYIHVGRMQGWILDGLNFPGHFLCRIEHGGMRLIFDVFKRCEILGAPDLRQLIKSIRGPSAELDAAYYAPASNREILVRLENNIKLRLIEGEDYAAALRRVDLMRLLAPGEYRLLLDSGVLRAKLGKVEEAIGDLRQYAAMAPTVAERIDAERMIAELGLL